MHFSASIAFEAIITEVGQRFFRFERTNYRPGFFQEKFGKFFHETADLKDFLPRKKIIIKISNIEPVAELLVQTAGKLVIRGVVNEKAAFGMSLRKPYPEKTTFFERAFKSLEFSEITESTILSSSKNPFEVGDFVQVIIEEALLESRPPPMFSSPKPKPAESAKQQSSTPPASPPLRRKKPMLP